ncbi:unnamed protein product [Sympodiomycopsis kandeliae]
MPKAPNGRVEKARKTRETIVNGIHAGLVHPTREQLLATDLPLVKDPSNNALFGWRTDMKNTFWEEVKPSLTKQEAIAWCGLMAEVQVINITYTLDLQIIPLNRWKILLEETIKGDCRNGGNAWDKVGFKSLKNLKPGKRAEKVLEAARAMNWRERMNSSDFNTSIKTFFATLLDDEHMLTHALPLPTLDLPTSRPWKGGNKEARKRKVSSKLDELKTAILSRSAQDAIVSLRNRYHPWQLRHLLCILCSYDADFLGASPLIALSGQEVADIVSKWTQLDLARHQVRPKYLITHDQWVRMKAVSEAHTAEVEDRAATQWYQQLHSGEGKSRHVCTGTKPYLSFRLGSRAVQNNNGYHILRRTATTTEDSSYGMPKRSTIPRDDAFALEEEG